MGVAPSSATPTNQSEGQSNLSDNPEICPKFYSEWITNKMLGWEGKQARMAMMLMIMMALARSRPGTL